MLITALVIACIAITAPIWAIEAKRKAREDLADRQDLETPFGDIANLPRPLVKNSKGSR